MNSMHNSLSGPGGYSGTYPGYVPPPSALPYYNGYPSDINQSTNHYYTKPGSSVPPGYSSGMGPYSTPPINNSSMYYQQYGLGYQYSYGKYGLSSSLGYSSDISSGPGGVHPTSIGTLQSPSADLGLTGSMFSKNSKFSGSQGSSSPHSNAPGGTHGSTVALPTTPNTPSPGPHPLSNNFRAPGATPSPPVDSNEGKKDIDKMKRCQVCGQVFRLMSECLAHMKTVHEAPHAVYSLQHSAGGHASQSMNSPHNLPGNSSRHGSIGAPDSPLMALERMGWGEKQNIMSAMQSSSPLAHSYTSSQTAPPHMANIQHAHHQSNYGSAPHSLTHPLHLPHQQSPARHSSPVPTSANSNLSHSSNQNSPVMTESNTDQEQMTFDESQTKLRRPNSYSVSSIIGETTEAAAESKNESNIEDNIEVTTKIENNNEQSNVPIPNNEPPTSEAEVSENVTKEVGVIEPEIKSSSEDSKLSQVQVSISEAVTETASIVAEKDLINKRLPQESDSQVSVPENEPKQEFISTPQIVGKKDLIREMQSSKNLKSDEEDAKETRLKNSKYESNASKTQETSNKVQATEVESNVTNETFPEDLSNANSAPVQDERQAHTPQPHAGSQSVLQPSSLQPPLQRHSSPPVVMYPNQPKQGGYGNWAMGAGGYPGQYPYPQGSNPQPNSSQQPPNSKPQGYHPMHARFPSQFHPGAPSGSQYPGHGYVQGHPSGNWYPRGDSKGMWPNWSSQSGQHYPQGYYGYPNTNPTGQKHMPPGPPPAHIHPPPQSSHMHGMPHAQKSPLHLHFPSLNAYHTSRQNSPTCQTGSNSMSPHDHKETVSVSPARALSSSPGRVSSSPGQVSSSPHLSQEQVVVNPIKPTASKSDGSSETPVVTKTKKPGLKIGPKSKIMSAKQLNQMDELDAYKCTITVHENGSLNGYTSPGSAETGGRQSCDSSDSEVPVDEEPKFTTLKPAKRKYFANRDGSFVGPKRIKLAKQVKERQKKRQRTLQEQLRQSELEEQLQATRVEKAGELSGPLGNILLQSSILLCDKKVEVSTSVEECIASMKSVRQQSSLLDSLGDLSKLGHLHGAGKKPGRKSQTKVFHNDKSVIVKKHTPVTSSYSNKKLRAKDFKWSNFIKSMRYWCKDCAHGFKTQREVTMHIEERCKINCLYMLECYVVVKDVQTHPEYGQKVQELLEEYQIDGDHNCITCGEIIARKADYLVHLDSHKDFMPWECTICGTRFKIRGSLKEHLRYTHMKGRVPCLKCNKVFPTSTLLRQHVKVHTQHYKYKSAKNREEELKAAMEATAGALEGTDGCVSAAPEEGEKLSHEANEYRSWCKLMERNALKNLSSVPGGSGHEDEESGDEGLTGADLSRSSSEFNS